MQKMFSGLGGGGYIVFQDNNLVTKSYYRVKQNLYDISKYDETEIINEIDKRFRDAIKLEYEKDIEYGYKHLNQLSGGLDSRMNLWVARDMGYHDMTCVTFSQTESTDERVAQQIGKALDIDNIFWPLDSVRHLLHIDEYVSMNYGTAIYGGVGAMKEILDRLNTNRFGVIHTGQLGDVIISSYLRNETELLDFSPGGTYSQLLHINHQYIEYGDREEYLLTVRGLFGILSSHFYLRNYGEVVSPFLDIDFFDFCMSIPLKLRINHYIYKKWILTKYPRAADFMWEKTGAKITESNLYRQFRRYAGVLMNPKLIFRKLGFNVNMRSVTGMNPVDLWWDENEMLRKTYDEYYKNSINNNFLSSEIKKDIAFVYSKGCTTEKMMAITALAVVNNFF